MGRQPIVRPNVVEICMKMKKLEPGGVRPKFVYVDSTQFRTDNMFCLQVQQTKDKECFVR